MKPDTFRTNFLAIEQKIAPHLSEPQNVKNKRFWLKRGVGLCLALILGVFLLGNKIYDIYKHQQEVTDLAAKEMIFYVQMDLDSQSRAGKELNSWFGANPNRYNIINYIIKSLGLSIGQEGRDRFKALFSGKISVFEIDVGDPTGLVAAAKLKNNPEISRLLTEFGAQETSNLSAGNKVLKIKIGEGGLIAGADSQELYGAIYNNYFIISSSDKAVTQAVNAKLEFAFPDGIVSNFFDKSFIKIYAQPEARILQISRFLPRVNIDTFNLNGYVYNNKLVFEIQEGNQVKQGIDTKFWSRFIVPSVDFVVISEKLSNISSNKDLALAKTGWERLYDFNFEPDFKSLLDNEGALILRNWADQFNSQNKKLDYLIISRGQDEMVLEKAEEIAKRVLAQKLPKEQIFVLPDNTEIVEKIADPTIFDFEIEALANVRIKYLRKQEVDFEFAAAVLDGLTIFSNSLDFLKGVVLGQVQGSQEIKDYDFLGLVNDCFDLKEGRLGTNGLFYLNLGQRIYQNYGVEKIIGTSQRACVY